MVRDIVKMLTKSFNHDTLTVQLPDSFEQLKGEDSNFEMVTSNTIQPVRLSFRHNIVARSVGVVLVNTHCKGLSYKNAKEKGESAKKLLKDVFEFDEVRVFTDLTKENIVDKLTALKKEAKKHEDASKIKDGQSLPVQAIAVIWIGHKLQASWYQPHKDLLAKINPLITARTDRNKLRIEEYGLGIAGKPINLSDITAEIVAVTKNTHVLLLEDFSTGMGPLLNESHISKNAVFNDITIEESTDLGRFHYAFNAKIQEMHRFFQACRKQSNRHVFQIPYHLKEANLHLRVWPTVKLEDVQQIIFDLRTHSQRESIRLCQHVNTFNSQSDIWFEKPLLIDQQEVDFVGCSAMIGQVGQNGDLVQIAVLHDLTKFDFAFFKHETPYSEISRLQVDRDHWPRSMLAQRSTQLSGSDEFYAALFESQKNTEPCRLIKFARETIETGVSYAIKAEKTIKLEGAQGFFINYLMVSEDSNLLVLEDQFQFYDSSLQHVNTIRLNELSSFQIKTVVQMSQSYENNGDYLLALNIEDGQDSNFKQIYQGKRRPTFNNLLTRCDASNSKITVQGVEESSCLLKNEVISFVLEYVKEKMLVHVTSRDILVVHNWQVVNQIHDPNFGNTLKLWLAPLPGFNEETFPFVIASGWQSYNLINVNDLRMEVLIEASGKNARYQPAGVLLEVDSGFDLHFTTQTITDENKRLVNWHCMAFKDDFVQTLEEHKRLPITNYKESLEIISSLQKELSEERQKNMRELSDQRQKNIHQAIEAGNQSKCCTLF